MNVLAAAWLLLPVNLAAMPYYFIDESGRFVQCSPEPCGSSTTVSRAEPPASLPLLIIANRDRIFSKLMEKTEARVLQSLAQRTPPEAFGAAVSSLPLAAAVSVTVTAPVRQAGSAPGGVTRAGKPGGTRAGP